jgi:hypothetical protein
MTGLLARLPNQLYSFLVTQGGQFPPHSPTIKNGTASIGWVRADFVPGVTPVVAAETGSK